MPRSPALLRVRGLRAGYGGGEVLHGIDLDLGERELTAVVGANGAGKTTLLLALSRWIAGSGTVELDGHDLSHARAHDMVRVGLAHVPEGRHVLASMNVEENLLVAARNARSRTNVDAIYARFPALAQRRHQLAGSLSGGEAQMLAIGRALVGEPKVLLLDEPSLGLAPKLIDAVFDLILEERRRGTAILLVEQNARRALAIADYAYVLERGAIRSEGPARDVLARDDVVNAYLGGPATGPANP